MQTFLIDKDAICMIGEIHFLKLFDKLTRAEAVLINIFIFFCSIATFHDFHLQV